MLLYDHTLKLKSESVYLHGVADAQMLMYKRIVMIIMRCRCIRSKSFFRLTTLSFLHVSD